MASTSDMNQGTSPERRNAAGRRHFTSRSLAARNIAFGSGVTNVAIARI